MLDSDLPALDDVARAIRGAWSRESSDDPKDWSEVNPALGQCAVSALVVRAIYGGDIVIATVLDKSGERTPDGHAWNILPSGAVVDLAIDQFHDGETMDVPVLTEPVIHPDPSRADAFAARVGEALGRPVRL